MKGIFLSAAMMVLTISSSADAGLFGLFESKSGCGHEPSCCAPAECCEPTCCAPAQACCEPSCAAPSNCCQPKKKGFFARIMDIERSKNKWLLGTIGR